MEESSDTSTDGVSVTEFVSTEGQEDCKMLCDEWMKEEVVYSADTRQGLHALLTNLERTTLERRHSSIKVAAREAVSKGATSEDQVMVDGGLWRCEVEELKDEQCTVIEQQRLLSLRLCRDFVHWHQCAWDIGSSGSFTDMTAVVGASVEFLVSADRCSDYYFGLTWSPPRRWLGRAYFPSEEKVDYDGHRFLYDEMFILAIADTKHIGLLEKYIIDEYKNKRKDPLCKNVKDGGEGRGKDGTVSCFYVARSYPLPL
jgi:hypothetical protein